MPGCCVLALLLFFGPRVVLALAWVFTDWFRAIDSTLVAMAGFLFAPWTTLAWMYIYFENAGRIGIIYGALLLIAIVADLSAYGGGRRYRAWRGR